MGGFLPLMFPLCDIKIIFYLNKKFIENVDNKNFQFRIGLYFLMY